MRVFVTGASGWIGSAVTTELISAGHRVVGLARSEKSAAALEALGADALRGDVQDLDVLRAGAGTPRASSTSRSAMRSPSATAIPRRRSPPIVRRSTRSVRRSRVPIGRWRSPPASPA